MPQTAEVQQRKERAGIIYSVEDNEEANKMAAIHCEFIKMAVKVRQQNIATPGPIKMEFRARCSVDLLVFKTKKGGETGTGHAWIFFSNQLFKD